jgi:aspartate aminotransferase-like enzyme
LRDLLMMVPGPTIIPPEVREALAQPSLYHRGEAFAELLAECTRGLQGLLGTQQPVAILATSGTGAVEAMIVNTLSPGDRVLAVASGKFGRRMGEIAAVYGAAVTWSEVVPGEAANPVAVAEKLDADQYRALLFVYNETSTGVKQPAAGLAQVAVARGAMALSDCVSAIAGMPVAMDTWGLAGVAAGSQKALMLPPGLAVVALSEAALRAAGNARMPRFYLDIRKALASLGKGQTPFTPNVNAVLALRAALRLIYAEGLPEFQLRHRRLARACRAAALAAGLELLASSEECASDVVTAIRSPLGVDSGVLVRAVRERHSIVISGGQDSLKGAIFRIGHLGAAQLSDLCRTWEAIAAELRLLGYHCDPQACIAAAERAYAGKG